MNSFIETSFNFKNGMMPERIVTQFFSFQCRFVLRIGQPASMLDSSTTSWKEKVFLTTHSSQSRWPLQSSSPRTSCVFHPLSSFITQIVTAGAGRELLGSFLLTICTSCLCHLAKVDKPKNRTKTMLSMITETVSGIFEQHRCVISICHIALFFFTGVVMVGICRFFPQS